jgi:hypothetical protein
MRCISIVMSLYFKIFSASFSITFLSPELLLLLFATFMEDICNYAPETNHVPMVCNVGTTALCGYKISIYGSACYAISHDKRFVLLVYFIITIIIIIITTTTITIPPS